MNPDFQRVETNGIRLRVATAGDGPPGRGLQVHSIGECVRLRMALEGQVVDDRQHPARPRKRDDVPGHEQQAGPLCRKGQRKAHLRPQTGKWKDGDVHT